MKSDDMNERTRTDVGGDAEHADRLANHQRDSSPDSHYEPQRERHAVAAYPYIGTPDAAPYTHRADTGYYQQPMDVREVSHGAPGDTDSWGAPYSDYRAMQANFAQQTSQPAYGAQAGHFDRSLPVLYGNHQLAMPMDRYLRELKSEANSWILIGIVGFFLGFGVISGPLTWKKGSELRDSYKRYNLEPAPEANVAYYTGILSTMLVGLSLAFLFLMLLFLSI